MRSVSASSCCRSIPDESAWCSAALAELTACAGVDQGNRCCAGAVEDDELKLDSGADVMPALVEWEIEPSDGAVAGSENEPIDTANEDPVAAAVAEAAVVVDAVTLGVRLTGLGACMRLAAVVMAKLAAGLWPAPGTLFVAVGADGPVECAKPGAARSGSGLPLFASSTDMSWVVTTRRAWSVPR
jgi:hypothetical protein